MINLTAHQLAKKLLALPDFPVFIDGIGEEVSLAYPPNIGKIETGEVVVLEMTTHKRYFQEQQMRGRIDGKKFPEN